MGRSVVIPVRAHLLLSVSSMHDNKKKESKLYFEQNVAGWKMKNA